MKTLRTICLLATILISNLAIGQHHDYVLILSKSNHQMMVLDYNTLTPVTEIPVGQDPHEVVVSTDKKKAYVSNAIIRGTGHIINVIDLESLKADHDIDTRPFYVPHGMAYLNNELWFTAQESKSVVIYDIKKSQMKQVIGTGQDFTHLLYVIPDGNRFYTTNVQSGTVSIFERELVPPYMPPTGVLPPSSKPRMEWEQTLIKTGVGSEGFDVSGNGKELWTARPDGKVIIVDLKKKAVKEEIDTHVQGLHRIKFTPDGKTVCIVSVKTGDLLFYDVKSRSLKKKMPIGKGAGIYMDAKSNRMFVSCTPDNMVVVVDLHTKQIIKKIPVGRPDGITSVEVPVSH